MAKPPMNGRPLLWVSWVGNALLTFLAAYVAFTHTGPLLPGTILTIAVCILAGNLLPLGAHALLYCWDSLAVSAEQAQAGESLRKAIIRLDQAETRLTEARDASAKATLVARQIPDRIEEQFRAVAQSLQDLDTDAVAALGGDVRRCLKALSETKARLEEAGRPEPATDEDADDASLKAVAAALAELQSAVTALAADLTAQRGEMAAPHTPPPAQPSAEDSSAENTFGDDPDWSVDITGTVDFSDDDDDPFDSIEDELRAADEESPAGDSSGDKSAPDDGNDRPAGEETDKAASGTGADKETGEPSAPSGKAAKPASKNRASKKKKAKEATTGNGSKDPHAELFSAEDMETAEPRRGGESILEAHAMIGIHNKLFLRGDPPLLDWDKGTPLDLTGIGEYRWKTAVLEEPLTCKLLLNDERWAIGENLVLRPGQTLVTHPKF
ncbi:MAG: hypothetical protein JJU00_10580 [Opitutales bacterium]|nr:hypothetical protein [Opitutales bacterium]